MMNNVLLASILVLCHVVNGDVTAPVCPEEGAISLAHNDTGVGGETYLTCSFNFPPNMLYFYQWFIRDNHELIYYYLANVQIGQVVPEYESIIKNESHLITNTTGSSTLAIRRNSDPEIVYMCKVFLYNHDQCIMDTTALTKVCPDPESMRLTQVAPVPRPEGSVELICEFRVARGQLDYYQWIVEGQIVPKYKYPSSEPNERHRVDANGGKSTLTVHSRLEDSHFTFTCKVVLRHGWNCSRNLTLHFEDPVIDLTIHEKSTLPSHRQVIACTVYKSGGNTNISVDVVSESHPHGIDILTHSDKKSRQQFTKLFELTMDEPGLVTCNVTDSKGHYSINRYIPPAECPHNRSAIVIQGNLAPRPAGLTSMTCHFRVLMAKLLKYSWTKQTDLVLDFWMTDSLPWIDSTIVKKELHKMYVDGGFSTIVIHSTYGHRENYICEVSMIDKEKCIGASLLRWEDPELDIAMFGGTRHVPQDPMATQETCVCGVSYAMGMPNMTIQETHPIKISEEVVLTPVNTDIGIYNASLYAVIYRQQNADLTCLVTDNIGSFTKTISAQKTAVCPTNNMEITQSKIVRSANDVLSLKCRFNGPIDHLQELRWAYGSHKGILYEYEKSEEQIIERSYHGNVSTNVDDDNIVSTLRINTSEFRDTAITCISRWRGGDSCLLLQTILFAPDTRASLALEEESNKKIILPYLLLAGFMFALCVTLLITICYFYKRRMKATVSSRQADPNALFTKEKPNITIGRLITQFKDPDFPANQNSLFGKMSHIALLKKTMTDRKIRWKRPWEIWENMNQAGNVASHPVMCTDRGINVEDIRQGSLRDGWLLASLGAVVRYNKFQENLIIEGKHTKLTKGGNGQLSFRLWVYGEWQYITIDDRLPTCNNRLVFAHSGDSSVFWVALLEKAFGKVYGSYKHLEGIGVEIDIMADLTGGIVVYHKTTPATESPNGDEKHGEELLKDMSGAIENKYPMTCATAVCATRKKQDTPIGAGNKHFFMITDIEKSNDPKRAIVWLRDTSIEYKKDDSCDCLSKLHQWKTKDCVFGIEFPTFVEVFEQVHICYVAEAEVAMPAGCDDNTVTAEIGQGLLQTEMNGTIPPICDVYTDDIVEYMPQYTFRKGYDTGHVQNDVQLMIGVLQKRTPSKTSIAMKFRGLEIDVYKVEIGEEVTEPLKKGDLNTKVKFIEKFSGLKRHREQGGRITINPGYTYVLIIKPTHLDIEMEYLLRILLHVTSDFKFQQLENRTGAEIFEDQEPARQLGNRIGTEDPDDQGASRHNQYQEESQRYHTPILQH